MSKYQKNRLTVTHPVWNPKRCETRYSKIFKLKMKSNHQKRISETLSYSYTGILLFILLWFYSKWKSLSFYQGKDCEIVFYHLLTDNGIILFKFYLKWHIYIYFHIKIVTMFNKIQKEKFCSIKLKTFENIYEVPVLEWQRSRVRCSLEKLSITSILLLWKSYDFNNFIGISSCNKVW